MKNTTTIFDIFQTFLTVEEVKMDITPEKIADIYKERWKIETFFKFIKQNLNVKDYLEQVKMLSIINFSYH